MRKTYFGRIAVCTVILAIQPIVVDGQLASYRAGHTIKLAPDVTLRVVAASLDAFLDVSLAGIGQVFELDFDKGAGRIVAIEPWKDPANSGVVLLVGATRIAPKALALRQPQKPEREVITVDKLERNRVNGRGAWIGFAARPNVQLLFDVPREIADSPTTLAIEILPDGKFPPLTVEIIK